MSKYFMNDSKLQELEQLMMLVPNFSPRGRGIIEVHGFGKADAQEREEEVFPTLPEQFRFESDIGCLNINGRGSSYDRFISSCFHECKSYRLQSRLEYLIRNCSGDFFISQTHRTRFDSVCRLQEIPVENRSPILLAVLFDILTKYISMIQSDSIGEWIIDRENNGTIEHPIQMPFVGYSKMVDSFQEYLYKFCEEQPEYEHTRYGETLEKNNLKWSTESMEASDVSKLDAKCVIALLIGAVRAERFCDGALLGFFNSGCILRWLERLKTIDEGGVFNDEQKTK